MTDEKTSNVGYRNPPMHTRFKKGNSGNLRGRPRKREGLNTILQRVLNRKVRMKDNDQKLPIRDALMWKAGDLAVQGDKQALALQTRILNEAGYDKPDPSSEVDTLKLFKEVAERLGFTGHLQEESDEG